MKNIWIWNHYATNMYENQAGRHYWFAENLINRGFKATIFCASTVHNSSEVISTNNKNFTVINKNRVPFVFVQTSEYKGNGYSRIKNMISFYKKLPDVAKEYSKQYGKPDAILASSVHPLTLIAGIKVAKKFGVPCICEVRDLWPETLVAYGSLSRKSLITKLMYQGEKKIYKNADKLIFTMEGGSDYIKAKKWDKANGGPIELNKVFHINNGVDLKSFNYNKENFRLNDVDLECKDTFKVIYTGSIRKANNVKKIVEIAEFLSKKGHNNIKFLIYGDGLQKEELEEYCTEAKLNNIIFKGIVKKNEIPYILSKSNLNIFLFQQNTIKKYGASLNKMFEYFASGKPIISDCEFGYDLIKKYNCGVIMNNANYEEIGNEIIRFSKIGEEEYQQYCKNAYKTAEKYDFEKLTLQLEKIILES